MEVVILCGGDGTRMWPYTQKVPKAMIPIGGRPILWHIMKLFAKNGHKEFKLLVGYKKSLIKKYFDNPKNTEPDWNIEYSNAGRGASKGKRIIEAYKEGKIKGDNFILAYGDDLCNVNIDDVIKKHNENGKLVTLTSVKLVSDFGILELNGDDTVRQFREKPQLEHWINGGYIVMSKKVISDYMIKNGGDETDAFEHFAKSGGVQVFKYDGFWKTMNTIKDMNILEELWKKGELQKQLKHVS